jgi:hypothetical protein
MIEWLYQGMFWVAMVGGFYSLLLGLIGRLPSLYSLSPLVLSTLGLLGQFFVTTVLLIAGNVSKGDPIEFYGYLLTALIVAVGAGFWALAERTKVSTIILGVANLTLAIMIFRMHQIWFG